tara:strand:+ start:435 stop:1415 length:981 start_codon:yes stop_codon:yes gene_type:complete
MCGGGGTNVTTATTEPWAEQKGYLTGGFERAKDIYDQGTPAYYPGETLAGFDPAQTAAQQATLGYAMGPRAAAQQAGAERSLLQGLSGQIDPNAYNPMVNALTSNVLSGLQNEVLPGLRQKQVMYQPGGSSKGNQEYEKAVANRVTAGMTKPIADMYTNAYNQAQSRAVQSGQLYPSIMSAPLNLYGAMGDVGAARRAMTQSAMDRDMARYQYESTAPQQALANYMSMISGNYGGTTTQTTPGKSGLDSIGQMIGIAGSLASLSDIRIKENIVPEGTKWKGLNVYAYNYIGDSTPRRGVMAQEVEGIYPDAVVTINGIKHVYYGEI